LTINYVAGYFIPAKNTCNRRSIDASGLCRLCLAQRRLFAETWYATKRPEKIDFSRENIDRLRLEITDTKKGVINCNKGVLAFKAFYVGNNSARRILYALPRMI